MTCCVCGKKMNFVFNLRQGSLFACPLCLHRSILPKNNETESYYDEKYFQDGQKFPINNIAVKDITKFPQFKTFANRINNILSLTTKEGPNINLLDVGCGAGLFINLCLDSGIRATGIDISEAAIKLSRVTNAGCFVQNFPEDIVNSYFDVVTMFDVLEHLKEPSIFVKKAYQTLKKGGLFVLSTPCADSILAGISGKKWHFYTPDHQHIFSTKSISETLKSNHFQIVSIKRDGQYTNLGYLISRIFNFYYSANQKYQIIFTKLGLYKIHLYLNLFDTMTVVAQKKRY